MSRMGVPRDRPKDANGSGRRRWSIQRRSAAVLHAGAALVTIRRMARRAHVLIAGRVQGVNFRASTQRRVEPLGIQGYVRNLPDGRVEAVFEGEESSVQEAIDWCQAGPPAAHVDHVEVDWQAPTGEFHGFSIRG